MAEDVQRVATSLKVSFADVVRECIENDLPKLKERGNKIKHIRHYNDLLVSFSQSMIK